MCRNAIAQFAKRIVTIASLYGSAYQPSAQDLPAGLAGRVLDVPPTKAPGRGRQTFAFRTCSIFPVGEPKMFSSSKRPVMEARVPGRCSSRSIMPGYSARCEHGC